MISHGQTRFMKLSTRPPGDSDSEWWDIHSPPESSEKPFAKRPFFDGEDVSRRKPWTPSKKDFYGGPLCCPVCGYRLWQADWNSLISYVLGCEIHGRIFGYSYSPGTTGNTHVPSESSEYRRIYFMGAHRV